MTPTRNDPKAADLSKSESSAKDLSPPTSIGGSTTPDSEVQGEGALQTPNRNIIEAADASKTELQKHPLDWVLACFALISLALNIYLLYDKKVDQAIKQPGPTVSRIVMPARDALILVGLKERRDLFFSHFPNPSFLLTAEWNKLISQPPQTDLELRDTQWRFLTVEDTTDSDYEDVRIEGGDGPGIEVGNLPSHNTLFIYASKDDSFAQAAISYKVRGAATRLSSKIPPVRSNEILIKTEFEVRKLGSLEGIDDQTKTLIRSKSAALRVQPK